MLALAGIAALPAALFADVLVTSTGERIETRGPWQVKGRQVVFTSSNGTLQALRLAEVNLEASTSATESALAPPPEPKPEPAPPRREPVLTITDADIPRGMADASVSAVETLIRRLRAFHEANDNAGVMDLVHRDGLTPQLIGAMRATFERIMESEIRDISFQPARNANGGVAEGSTDQADIPPIGRLLVDLANKTEAGDSALERATFSVGNQLGTYVLMPPPPSPAAAQAPESEDDVEDSERDDGESGGS